MWYIRPPHFQTVGIASLKVPHRIYFPLLLHIPIPENAMVPYLTIAILSIAICLVLSSIIEAILDSLPAKDKRAGLESTRKPKCDRKVKAETAKKEDSGSKTKRKRRSKTVPVVELCESTQTLQEFSNEVPKIQTKEIDLVDIEEKHNGHDIGCWRQVDLIDQRAANYGEIEGDLINEEVGIAESREIAGGLIDEEDDWEGVESTELERLFGAAAVFVGSRDNAYKISSLGRDLNLQLYGLYKIAIEGPCHVPQPMALNLSARAKWNAWRQLGDMSPEVAMELYISVLSSSIPGWMGEDCRDLASQTPQFALDKLAISDVKNLCATQKTLKEGDESHISDN